MLSYIQIMAFSDGENNPDLHWNRHAGLACAEFSARIAAATVLPWERKAFPLTQGKKGQP